MRRDLDEVQDIAKDHEKRIASLERRRLSDMVDWKMAGVIGLLLMGLTGNLTIAELKALVF